MAIAGVTEDALAAILKDEFTPSHWVESVDRLYGRDKSLKQIQRALASKGRNIFIFGDRGVGKTSLAVTAAAVHNDKRDSYIYVPCGETTSFATVMQAVADGTLSVSERAKKSKRSGGFSVGVEGVGSISANYSSESPATSTGPMTVVDALNIVRAVGTSSKGTRIVVIDELDRIQSKIDKTLIAELIKNAATLPVDVRFVFCGIGRDIDQILGHHPSAGRYFEPIELEKLHHDHLRAIVAKAATRIGVTVGYETLVRIGIISDGFPHFVHLLGHCLFWAMHDDPDVVSKCERRHYDFAIKGALEKTENALKLAYQKATEKTKNKVEYEEALWALADKAESRRQVSSIYEQSYLRIMTHRSGKQLDQETFNHRLLTLRGESHGEIVIGHGSGWYSFKENVLRGYVRLKAEDQGVELSPDPM